MYENSAQRKSWVGAWWTVAAPISKERRSLPSSSLLKGSLIFCWDLCGLSTVHSFSISGLVLSITQSFLAISSNNKAQNRWRTTLELHKSLPFDKLTVHRFSCLQNQAAGMGWRLGDWEGLWPCGDTGSGFLDLNLIQNFMRILLIFMFAIIQFSKTGRYNIPCL